MGISCASEDFTEQIRGAARSAQYDHHRNLIDVLARLNNSGLTLKCEFYRSELTFFWFSPQGISATEDWCSALRSATAPTNASELRNLWGMVLYGSRFIVHLNTITDPLWKLCQKSVPWRWSNVEQESFQSLKTRLKKGASLAYFWTDWSTEMHVDASPVGLCAVLVQYNPQKPSQRQVVCIVSRGLTDVERRYSQCEKLQFGDVRDYGFICSAQNSHSSPTTGRSNWYLGTQPKGHRPESNVFDLKVLVDESFKNLLWNNLS